jgi:hypothetical protein
MGVKPYARHRASLGLLGGTPAGVRGALKRIGIAQAADGSFDADALHAEWEREQRVVDVAMGEAKGGRRKGEAVPQDLGTRADWVIRHERARALDREHELLVKQEAVVPVDYMVEQLEMALTSVAGKLNLLPGTLALAVAGLQQGFRDRLAEMRGGLLERSDSAGLAVLDAVEALDSDIVSRAQTLLDDAIQGALPSLADLGDDDEEEDG